jgi:hypothetical protein
MSICAVIGYRWDGRRSRPLFQTREGSYNTERLIAFLDDLKRHVHRRKAILVWDGVVLEGTIRHSLPPAQAYHEGPGRDPQTG